MDDVAQYLLWLQDQGVEVFFRPLHEMNQGCFWWGGRPHAQGSRRLFQITHDYFTNEKGLDNLIWTWNVQDFGSLPQDINDYDPGEAYYEVLSLDVYEGFAQWKYDVMRNKAGSKPFAIGECAELPSANRLANENQWAFWMSWSELTFEPPNTDQSIRNVFNSNQAITLDEMPGDWSIRPPTPTIATLRSYHNTYLVSFYNLAQIVAVVIYLFVLSRTSLSTLVGMERWLRSLGESRTRLGTLACYSELGWYAILSLASRHVFGTFLASSQVHDRTNRQL